MNKTATVSNSIWSTDYHCEWILFDTLSNNKYFDDEPYVKCGFHRTFHKKFCHNSLGFIIPSTTSSKHLWNAGQLLPYYTAQHPRRQPSSYSSPWEPEISLHWECSAVTTCILNISIERYAVSWSSSHFTTRQKGPSIQCIWEWMGLDVVKR
jgi:hypothetical protein